MATSSNLLIISSLFITALIIIISSSTVVNASDNHRQFNWMPPATTSTCQGSLAECFGEDEEFSMDSESNRRILATTKYISYGALQRNTVPCSQRGASYYNCKSGAQANPYSRGCSAIARCRS